ncbi:MAG TPA: hypothetical protein VF744_07480 [Beijerinckiaceae bacterium]|jgi:hypothetical protein
MARPRLFGCSISARSGDAGRGVSRQTVARWLKGYDYEAGGETRHSGPLWRPDYANDDDGDGILELSFRDLVELRFVKAFRDAGLGLAAIRACFERAVEEVRDERPFSTRRFRTDGKTIFLDITRDVREGELIDLRRRQGVFRTMVEPSLRDLEFEADAVAPVVSPRAAPAHRRDRPGPRLRAADRLRRRRADRGVGRRRRRGRQPREGRPPLRGAPRRRPRRRRLRGPLAA